MPIHASLQDLYRPIEDELDQVRALVGDLWRDVLALVQGPVPAPPKAGGKLLRPALCLLSAGAAGADDVARFAGMATSMEMLHLAALAHDDVIDSANLRRGSASLNAMWSDHAAVLGGDYLVARGVSLLASYSDTKAVSNAIDCIRIMAEGELVDFGQGPKSFTLDSCLRLARAKTASLFSVSCSTPAVLVNMEYREHLAAYGIALGTAFQLIDDLLDLTQDSESLGKPSCGDVAEGKKTIPILLLREQISEADAERLDEMRGRDLSEEERAWVAERVENSGARQRTHELARSYVDQSLDALRVLPDSVYRESMVGLSEFILVRAS
jgi:octaprenyl-diphosphate synthase